MFTGIIESKAELIQIIPNQSNISFVFKSELAKEFRVDQSVSHNGVCLTVEKIDNTQYQVTAIEETLIKTNLGSLKVGDFVNLERSMKADARFDGHIVQGHVDQIGYCEKITDLKGSWQIDIRYDSTQGNITVEKGSICLNGISLTVFNSQKDGFSVAIIPYTWVHTNLQALKEGDQVNLEFDIVGKYLAKLHRPFMNKI